MLDTIRRTSRSTIRLLAGLSMRVSCMILAAHLKVLFQAGSLMVLETGAQMHLQLHNLVPTHPFPLVGITASLSWILARDQGSSLTA